jgi:hypothetical protein
MLKKTTKKEGQNAQMGIYIELHTIKTIDRETIEARLIEINIPEHPDYEN